MYNFEQFILLIPRIGGIWSHGTVKQFPFWVGILIVSVLVLIAVIGFWKEGKKKKWEDGVFPPHFPFNRDHLMEAHIAAAAAMVGKDPYRTTGKLVFINSYLQREFSDVYYDFKESYRHSLRYPVTMKSLAHWLNLHVRTEAEKRKIVRFLLDLAWYDGELNDNEVHALKVLTAYLQLDWAPVEELIRERDNRRYVPRPQISKRSVYLKTLGLDDSATPELIKTTYKKLVKLYHPDMFMQESVEVREKAAAKFREIQEAYECLIG
jgi:DnaJ-domain-containing protein 1